MPLTPSGEPVRRRLAQAFAQRLRLWQTRWREPSLTLLLLLQMLVIFVAAPLAAAGIALPAGLAVINVLALMSLVTLASRSPGPIALTAIALPMAVIGASLRYLHPSVDTDWLAALGSLLALSAVCWVVAVATFGPGRITPHRVRGAVVLYLNFALIFVALNHLLEELSPGAFTGLYGSSNTASVVGQLIYYNFTVLTTTGFGDIVPVHPFARALANLEAVIGQLYPATLLARLVTLELDDRRR